MSKLPHERSFASHEKAKYWNYELNGDVKPEDVSKSTHNKYWFKCYKETCNHNFQIALNNLSIKKGNRWCPYCCIPSRLLCKDNNCLLCFNKSFASHEKASFWSDKNGRITPRDVFKACDTIKYYLKCNSCNHDFIIALSSLNNGKWCGFCGNRQLCDNNECKMCYNNSFASCEKSIFWNKEKNGEVIPRQIFKGISIKFSFDCNKCNHVFQMGIYSVVSGQWCNYCANKVLCDDNNCITCFNNSFASHEKSIFWNKEKNDTIIPRNVFLNSKNKYWFDCNNCKHSFDMNLSNINSNNHWCKYCSTISKYLCNDENCMYCFNRSLASHEKSIFWSNKNGTITPRQVFKGSHTKYLFDCNKCNHTFEMPTNHLTKNCWCNYCGNRILCDETNCITCFNKSFASYKNVIFWDYEKNGTTTPRQVFKGTPVKYWFKCEKNHSFNSNLSHISNGSWCPFCVNKTEAILFKFLQSIYSSTIPQFSPDFVGKKRYDFCIPEHNIIIELDGIQHFMQVSNWKSPEETQINDKNKEKLANDNGFSIIRLLQEDVFNDTYNWQYELQHNITTLAQYIATNKKIKNIYMCKNDEYITL